MILNSARILVAKLAFCAMVVGFPLAAVAGPTTDTDGDTVPDVIDTCSALSNAGDCDSDQDGYGNACDFDMDQNGLQAGGDIPAIITLINNQDPAGDHDCNGVIGGGDLTSLLTPGGLDGTPPGPSGLSCAGTVTCP